MRMNMLKQELMRESNNNSTYERHGKTITGAKRAALPAGFGSRVHNVAGFRQCAPPVLGDTQMSDACEQNEKLWPKLRYLSSSSPTVLHLFFWRQDCVGNVSPATLQGLRVGSMYHDPRDSLPVEETFLLLPRTSRIRVQRRDRLEASGASFFKAPMLAVKWGLGF